MSWVMPAPTASRTSSIASSTLSEAPPSSPVSAAAAARGYRLSNTAVAASPPDPSAVYGTTSIDPWGCIAVRTALPERGSYPPRTRLAPIDPPPSYSMSRMYRHTAETDAAGRLWRPCSPSMRESAPHAASPPPAPSSPPPFPTLPATIPRRRKVYLTLLTSASMSPDVPAPQHHTLSASRWTFSHRLSATTVPSVARVSAPITTVRPASHSTPTMVVPVLRRGGRFAEDRRRSWASDGGTGGTFAGETSKDRRDDGERERNEVREE
mmetsp:Transcript_39899/g.120097  ORF Transcript_39899/g.120097 Transcript_39899/m.120097 type:complete len:267 (-) Transcript_39899:535-1335(-)